MANNSRAHVRDRTFLDANGAALIDWYQARHQRRAYSISRWERIRLPLVLISMGSLAGAVLAYYLVIAFFAIMRKHHDRTN